jgi:hypothetical protein
MRDEVNYFYHLSQGKKRKRQSIRNASPLPPLPRVLLTLAPLIVLA